MSGREITHLAVSTLVLSLAFGIAFAGGTDAFTDSSLLLQALRISFITVAIGFTAHEMSHRWLAKRFGLDAAYYMNPMGLVIAVVVSFTGWIFAAPGAVRIYRTERLPADEKARKRVMGIISIAGPLANIAIAFVFLAIYLITSSMEFWTEGSFSLWQLSYVGLSINAWLAAFNMIPFGMLDGRDVFAWNKLLWLVVLLAAIGLYLYARLS